LQTKYENSITLPHFSSNLRAKCQRPLLPYALQASPAFFFFAPAPAESVGSFLQVEQRAVGMDNQRYRMASTEEIKQVWILQPQKQTFGVHVVKNMRGMVWRTSVSPMACPFSKHED